jgi:hypothetical protein
MVLLVVLYIFDTYCIFVTQESIKYSKALLLEDEIRTIEDRTRLADLRTIHLHYHD